MAELLTPWWHDTSMVAQWLRALDDQYPHTHVELIRQVESAHLYSREQVQRDIDRYLQADAA